MCQVHYYYSPFSRRRYNTDPFDGDDASVDLGHAWNSNSTTGNTDIDLHSKFPSSMEGNY
jgi:hypothetical protein